MSVMTWAQPGDREIRAGLDHGALYVGDVAVPWNGLISVEESSTGGELESYYYDGRKYFEHILGEDFQAVIEAYMWPPLFDQCLGYVDGGSGLFVAQQRRKRFNLAYRIQIASDLTQEAGYELHLVWNALVQPVVKRYQTKADTVNPTTFSFTISCTPPPMNFPGYVPSGHVVLDSRIVPADVLISVEDGLFGEDPVFPTPEEIVTTVFPIVLDFEPIWDEATRTLTIPDTDATYYILPYDDGGITALPPGVYVLGAEETKKVKAKPKPGHRLPDGADDEWEYGGEPTTLPESGCIDLTTAQFNWNGFEDFPFGEVVGDEIHALNGAISVFFPDYPLSRFDRSKTYKFSVTFADTGNTNYQIDVLSYPAQNQTSYDEDIHVQLGTNDENETDLAQFVTVGAEAPGTYVLWNDAPVESEGLSFDSYNNNDVITSICWEVVPEGCVWTELDLSTAEFYFGEYNGTGIVKGIHPFPAFYFPGMPPIDHAEHYDFKFVVDGVQNAAIRRTSGNPDDTMEHQVQNSPDALGPGMVTEVLRAGPLEVGWGDDWTFANTNNLDEWYFATSSAADTTILAMYYRVGCPSAVPDPIVE